MSDFKLIAGAVLVVVLMAFGMWSHVAAPCSWYQYHTVKDVPARCLMHR
ncbi:hypothetical protein ABZV65_04265 [Streptomyces bauhiniae]